MKQVLVFILVVLVAVSFKEPPKKRYFFIAWVSAGANGSQNIVTEGNFINYQETIDNLENDDEILDKEGINIVGIYEFKSKAEMDYFWKGKK